MRFLTLLLLLLGCSQTPQMDYSAVTLVPAYGRVTLDGHPLAGAVITFDAADGQFSYARTNANGEYALQFDSVKAGVTPGPKTVRISTRRKLLGLSGDEEQGGEGGEEPAATSSSPEEKVPARYNVNSQLRVEVTAEQTEYNFDLTSS